MLKDIYQQSRKRKYSQDHLSQNVTDKHINPNCRLCGNQEETIQHIIASCPNLNTSMHLPLRHNKVANVIYQNIAPKEEEKCRQPIREFYCNEQIKIWWDPKIKTLTVVQHDKPNIAMWKKEDKQCFIIDISVGLDGNITKNFNQKRDKYLPLELKRLYDKFNFEIIPLTIGATDLVRNDLKLTFKRIGINNIDDVTLKCQKLRYLEH